MQIPIVNGIYTDMTADYRTSYPLNLVPVPKQNGISAGYLRKADGIKLLCGASRSGVDRGGINWKDVCYRVIGSTLYRVTEHGQCTAIGAISGSNQCTFAYSFDRLAIAGGGNLYYLQGNTLSQVTNTNLGRVVDAEWIDGYFVTTDGEYVVQTELNDPTKVSPTKYGSSEADPDPIIGLLKVRNELCVFNRYTIEVFDNTGGAGFAFSRIDGAMMTKGLIGTSAKCQFAGSFAFVGSGKNQPCSVYLGANGGLSKVATREIERILADYTDAQLSEVVLESKEQDMHQHLYLHLPDKTMVYDFAASQVMQQPIWFELSSSTDGKGAYRAINHVWCYNRWIVGDRIDGRIGVLDNKLSSHYGKPVTWQIQTTFIYNGGQSGQIKSVELVGLTGRVNDMSNPQVFLSYTKDGLRWSNERLQSQGMRGHYSKRIVWLRAVGKFQQMVGLRFRGCDDSLASFTAVEIDVEGFGNGG
ncbi:packaged DNA stabilization protein [Psychrobacter pygoscelis]|uniref:packaged DNA stabilization protein n=1 Tax=Psychrobacter pygoscelis TaxID=2488563 RepID=UPI00103B31A6|nr:packaged DNA stabilization protein [Psychrobacter pygoscelis]